MEELKVKITGDVGQFKDAVKQALGEVENLGSKGSSSVSSLETALKRIGKTVATVFTVKAITEFAKSCVEAADSVRETEATYRYIVGDGIAYADAALQTFTDHTGIMSGRVKEGFTQLIASYQGLGVSTTDAVNASEKMLEMSADMAAMWNTTSENVLPALQSAMTGNYRSLRSYGLILTDTIVAQQAAELGLIANAKAFDKLSEAEKAVVRTEITQHMLELQGVAGRAAAESGGLANTIANLKQAWTEFLATVGQPILENVVLPAIQGLTEGLQAVAGELPDLSGLFAGFGEKVASVVQFIVNNKDALLELAGVIAAAIGVITAYNAVMAIAAVVTNATFGVFLLIVAAIAAVSAAIYLCITHWDEIKAKVAEVVAAIKAKVSEWLAAIESVMANIIAAIVSAWESVKSAVVSAISAVGSAISAGWNAVKSFTVSAWSSITSAVSAAWGNITSAISSAWGNIKSAVSSGVNAVQSTVSSVFSAISGTVSGIWSGIKSTISSTMDGIKAKITSAVNTIKNVFNFSWKLPSLKLPHFTVSGSFSLNPPSVPSFGISWYAKGGVFDMPTLFGYGNGKIGGLGENGAEAVVPLENNTQWLDRIAERLSEKIGTNPIVMEVDGKVFGQIACDSINGLTRQTGRLNINVI